MEESLADKRWAEIQGMFRHCDELSQTLTRVFEVAQKADPELVDVDFFADTIDKLEDIRYYTASEFEYLEWDNDEDYRRTVKYAMAFAIEAAGRIVWDVHMGDTQILFYGVDPSKIIIRLAEYLDEKGLKL